MNCSKCQRAKTITGNKHAKCMQHGITMLLKKAGIMLATNPKPIPNSIKLGGK